LGRTKFADVVVAALPAVVLVALVLVLVALVLVLVALVLVLCAPESVVVVVSPVVPLVISVVIVVATSSEPLVGSVDKSADASVQPVINIVAMIAMRIFTSRILTTEPPLVD